MSQPLDTSMAVTFSIKRETPCFVRMFKPRFALLVETGTKLQTIRPTPKRLPHPGDRISLRAWTGKPYRSKQRVLRDALIMVVELVTITKESATFSHPPLGKFPYRLTGVDQLNHFALADGFTSWIELVEWFDAEHGLPFSGICIHWL